MQSIHAEPYLNIKEIASAARSRKGPRARLKTATYSWTGPGILTALFLASLAYVVFGDPFALEASPLPQQTTRIPPGAPDSGTAANTVATPADYFPAAYPDRGRDGEGNVMTYEHD